MKVREIMTENPACCTPEQTVREAARLMAQNDCGSIPVVEEGSRGVVGVVTDRDLAIRVLAEGRGPDTPVSQAMTADPACCGPDDDVERVERLMAERQVRRVPVVEGGRVVGMVAQADLALHPHAVSDEEVGQLVEEISQPSR
ncbi:MAG TPA: CBS domain-containing protein [Thermoanaerobaculia bacterium]|nr:CBS domain-containing protein [Thermoanaerobaculia bacterium]